MIEKVLYDYLKNKGFKVYLEKTSGMPKEYVLIDKTGGGGKHLHRATIAIQSYSESLYKASALNERIKDAMEQFDTESEVTSVSLNSDYNFTDTATKEYRYQAVFDIQHY